MNAMIDMLDRRASDSGNCRFALKALGAASLAAAAGEPLAAQAEKGGKNKNKAKKLCKRQVGQCNAAVTVTCQGSAQCEADLLRCCLQLGQCNAKGFIECVSGTPAEN
jgi:hypothetical protein